MFLLVTVLTLSLAGCSQDTPVEQAEEEAKGEEVELTTVVLQEGASSGPGVIGPALGAVAALIGAALGAYFAHTFSLRREQSQREAELKGILRRLDFERHKIKRQLEVFNETPRWITDAPDHVLATPTWDESGTKLSQLLGNDLVYADMIKFFGGVQEIDRFRLNTEDDQCWRQERIGQQLDQLRQHHDRVEQHIRDHGIPQDWLVGTTVE